LLQSFFIIHKSGICYFSKNLQGDTLDEGLTVGFASSVSDFTQTLVGEDVRELISTKSRFTFKEYGDFVFVAYNDLLDSSFLVQATLGDICGICEFLFGSYEFWDEDTFNLSGAQDIISFYFSKVMEPTVAVGGVNQVHLGMNQQTFDRLDKLLAYFESQDGICGNGTMLVIGESVLYSRMALSETRMVMQFIRARPLDGSSVRHTPIFLNGSWHAMYTIRIQNYLLVVKARLDATFTSIQKRVEELRASLIQSRLEIPTEEPPILLRLYAKRETLAMLYHNIKTGHVIFPQLRPAPEVQQREILNSFWAFFGDASAAMRIPGMTEFSLHRDQYRFYSRCVSAILHMICVHD
ncbi:hypothetical protein M427DRAFT_93983, partial [Gonapodya prolifera JEL478]